MDTATSSPVPVAGQVKNLVLATWAFAISFWAWNMIGPLGVRYTEQLGLSASSKALLVATPVLVGSVGRILAGALTDRYGGRVMFVALLLLSTPCVLLTAVAGNQGSYGLLLAIAFFLGIAGTSFAVGIPFVGGWFDRSRRGLATGVFGAGMGGTALSAYFTPRFVEWFGYTQTHVLIAAALVVTALVTWVFLRDGPGWRPNAEPVVPKMTAALRLAVTWQMSFLYAVVFGGFVAFSTYLPTYLTDVYGFDLLEAGTRTAGFAVVAVLARPVGGTLSDRFGAKAIVVVSLTGAALLAVAVAFQPAPEVPAGAAFVLLALFLGLGTGGVFAWVAQTAPAERVGSITGLVGAAGGLGGYFPPLVMGATYNSIGQDYTVGLVLLTLTALVALAATLGIRSASGTDSRSTSE